MLQLYKTLVRLHLEFHVQFLLLHNRKNVAATERTQKRFTRTLPELKVLYLLGIERLDLSIGLREETKYFRGTLRATFSCRE